METQIFHHAKNKPLKETKILQDVITLVGHIHHPYLHHHHQHLTRENWL
jgi:hypothetical protein